MTKCEYCGKEIGLLAVRYTWLDKEKNRAMHDRCYEKYKNESLEGKGQLNKEENKETTKKMIKSKILGIVILIFAIAFTLFAIYGMVSFGFGFSIYNLILFLFSYLIGIELIRIKKEGIYHKLMLILGVIFLVLYMIMIVTTLLIVTLW
jgi:hypothetical protein